MTAETTIHETSLAVWAVPATVAAGESFAVTVGVKSSGGCALAGRSVEVRDGTGAAITQASLRDDPWPGTDALFWAAVALRAPNAPGRVALTAHFDAAGMDQPHQSASSAFDVTVVARPQHTLAVTVAAGDTPIEGAYVRLGPYRAVTDASGRAVMKLAAGRYELHVWKAGYDAPELPLNIPGDMAIRIEMQPQPEADPDAVWTA